MESRAATPFDVTVITPTTGRGSLLKLIQSIDTQESAIRVQQILLWDDKREPGAPTPDMLASGHRRSIVMPDGFGRFGDAPGSALRAVGLLAAVTPWVTFADDDVWWEPLHLQTIWETVQGHNWGSTLRRVWSADGAMFGVDRFESVGDDQGRRVPYEMCDNNCMFFKRDFGVAAAPLYRQTMQYNDDRLMYAFLKQYAGKRVTTGRATINQICPDRLKPFFQAHCSPD
jgi:hypothetical protein